MASISVMATAAGPARAADLRFIPLPQPAFPRDLLYNPIANKVYVSNVGAPGPNTPPICSVSVIADATITVIKTLSAGDEPTAFCYSDRDNRIYWVNERSHTVAVVDAKPDTRANLIQLGTNTVQPVDIAFNSVNGPVCTANRLTLDIGVITAVCAQCIADIDSDGVFGGHRRDSETFHSFASFNQPLTSRSSTRRRTARASPCSSCIARVRRATARSRRSSTPTAASTRR